MCSHLIMNINDKIRIKKEKSNTYLIASEDIGDYHMNFLYTKKFVITGVNYIFPVIIQNRINCFPGSF